MDGSRYGQVGTVTCDCGAKIHCTDSDNIIEYLDTFTTFDGNDVARFHIDFKELYRLTDVPWRKVKKSIGFDIFDSYGGKTIGLGQIIEELKVKYNLQGNNMKEHQSGKFERLPMIVNTWFDLFNEMGHP